MAAVPTSKTPHPHAHAHAKPGTKVVARMRDTRRVVRPDQKEANGGAEPRVEVDEFMSNLEKVSDYFSQAES
jgi:hypothetical protein